MMSPIDCWAAELVASIGRARNLLGIAGPPGSGKSTLAQQLAERVNVLASSAAAAVVSIDGFHLTNAQLDHRGLRSRKGAPDTFDVTALLDLLSRLRRAGEAVAAPIYSRALHEPVPDALRIEPSTNIILVEGNYLLLDEGSWSAVRPLLDECWYLDVPREVCLERVRQRHIRGGCTPQLAAQKIATNDGPNYDLVAATRGRADRVTAMHYDV